MKKKFIVIGSGPASLATCQILRKKDYEVTVIDGGGKDLPALVKNRTIASQINDAGSFKNHWSNHALRKIGGTSHVWGGWTTHYPDDDDWMPPETKHYYREQAYNFLGHKVTGKFNADTDNFSCHPYFWRSPRRVTLDDFKNLGVNILFDHHVLQISQSKNSTNLVVVKSTDLNRHIQIKLPKSELVLAAGASFNAGILMASSNDIALSSNVGLNLSERPKAYVLGHFIATDKFLDYVDDLKKDFKSNTSVLYISIALKGRNSSKGDLIMHFVLSPPVEESSSFKSLINKSNSKPIFRMEARFGQLYRKTNRLFMKNEKLHAFCSWDEDLLIAKKEAINFANAMESDFEVNFIFENDWDKKIGGSGHTLGTTIQDYNNV